MQTITLNNGKMHPVTWCGASDGALYAEMSEKRSVQAVAREFSNEEATRRIVYQFAEEMRETYENYCLLVGVRMDAKTGYCTVTLVKKGDDGT